MKKVKSLEMIGEAASKVSKECQSGWEPVPWEEGIDMKRQLVHTHWEIDRDWVRDMVPKDLPLLINALEEILPSEGD